jgi:hypothetical protein
LEENKMKNIKAIVAVFAVAAGILATSPAMAQSKGAAQTEHAVSVRANAEELIDFWVDGYYLRLHNNSYDTITLYYTAITTEGPLSRKITLLPGQYGEDYVGPTLIGGRIEDVE